MMQMELTAKSAVADDKLKAYVAKKIGKLDKYMSRHARRSAHVEVRLRELKEKNQKFECEATIHLPHENIVVREATINMYAAVDVVAEKLKGQLKKYHEKNLPQRGKVRGAIQRVRNYVRPVEELL